MTKKKVTHDNWEDFQADYNKTVKKIHQLNDLKNFIEFVSWKWKINYRDDCFLQITGDETINNNPCKIKFDWRMTEDMG